jgi:hypothetical protein
MGDDRPRMKERMLIVGGFGCLVVATALVVFGTASVAVFTFVFLGLGTVLLLLGLVGRRRRDVSEPLSPAARPVSDPRERVVWIAGAALAGLAVVAAVVAATVAVGDATGHAVGHLVVGLLCLLLFGAVALVWRPSAGSGKASARGMILLLLGAGALGSLIESLGGAGYDAANLERRIMSLTWLHPIGGLFAPVAFLAIPIGVVALTIVIAGQIARSAGRP